MQLKPYNIGEFSRCWAEQRKAAMGLDPKKHLPDYHAGIYELHGISIWLDSRSAALARGQSKNKPQRVRAMCPKCGCGFAAGNLAQHYRKCKA